MSNNFRTGGCSAKIWIVNKTSLPRNLLKQIESVIWARRPSVEGGGGLYFLEPHNLLKWVARSRVLKPSSHSHLLYCLPCGLTVIHLRLCDRKTSLGARRFEPQWIRFTLAVNSCSGSGSAAVVSNCYQLAWIVSVSRVASEVCDSRRWLKFKLDHSPLLAIAAVKVIWISSDDKTGESEVAA